MNTLFTSYKCDQSEPIIQMIIERWKLLNPDFNIRYFSDKDVYDFFKNSPYFDTYNKLKNGVAIADFFRICYIYENGGYWFDIDLEPISICIPSDGKAHLFDCGFKNISYMLIGGTKNKLFEAVINEVSKRINENYITKKRHLMEITGPRIIQEIVFKILNINNADGNFPGTSSAKTYLTGTDFEFKYMLQPIQQTKTNLYHVLQKKYKKHHYTAYNFI